MRTFNEHSKPVRVQLGLMYDIKIKS